MTDVDGRRVPGVLVTFVVEAVTGTGNIWTLGTTPGVQTATASFGGMTVTFTAFASSGS